MSDKNITEVISGSTMDAGDKTEILYSESYQGDDKAFNDNSTQDEMTEAI